MKKAFQDILSSVKTALTSDTGKAIGMGIASTAAGALLGGEAGVQAVGALGSAVQNARERKKREEREAEDRDLRKLQMTKAELDLSNAKDRRLYEKQLEMSGLQLEEKREDIMKKRIANAPDQYKTSSASDKYGKISAHDVALEDKVGKVKQLVDPKITPAPLTGPESLTVDDEEQLQKNLEKIQTSGAQYGADAIMKAGAAGAGKEFLRKNRQDLARELQTKGLNPAQESAAWREMQEQIAPGSIAQAKKLLETKPKYTGEESIGMALPGFSGATIGAGVGGTIGSLLGPFGTLAGSTFGGMVGKYAMEGVTGAMDKTPKNPYDESKVPSMSLLSAGSSPAFMNSQKDVTPTPAVAGANKTAADMAEYSMSLEATKLLNNLRNTTQPQDIPAIIQQLPQLADFKALPVGDQERILADLRGRVRGIGMNYGIPKEVESFRDTINAMGSWATNKLGIGG
jgi:hypothetical protein